MSLEVIRGKRENLGGCLACDPVNRYSVVLEVHLGNSSVRLCPNCAKELSLRLHKQYLQKKA